MILTKHFGLQTGYSILWDLPYGFTLALGHRVAPEKFDWRRYMHSKAVYRLIIEVYCGLPGIVWAERYWHMNDPGMVKGLPIPRRKTHLMVMVGLRRWPKSMYWHRHFSVKWYD